MGRTIGNVKLVKHDGTFAWVIHPDTGETIKRKMQGDIREHVRIDGYDYELLD